MFAGEENACQVGIENSLPAFERHFMNQSTHIDPGIGEDAIGRTELFMDHGEGLLHLAFVADITGNAGCCATLSPQSLRSLLSALAILVQNGDPVTAPGAKQSGRAPNTTTASGNDNEPWWCHT